MFMSNETDIVLSLYRGLISLKNEKGIPVAMRPNNIVGTVQDDPFDCWVEEEIRKVLPQNMEIFHSGQLTTPDLVIRDTVSGTIIGLEIKKLIQDNKGKDPRGMTIDYNSCLPCGSTLVKVGGEARIIPCYYVFALLSHKSDSIVTLIIMDGDFINYDYNLHKEAKYSNYTEYQHGPYGEGSVRHRKMYTYPNPLNSQLDFFYMRHIIVLKKGALENRKESQEIEEQIERVDKYGNSFFFSLLDETKSSKHKGELTTLTDIFEECKHRMPKERVAYIPDIPALEQS